MKGKTYIRTSNDVVDNHFMRGPQPAAWTMMPTQPTEHSHQTDARSRNSAASDTLQAATSSIAHAIVTAQQHLFGAYQRVEAATNPIHPVWFVLALLLLMLTICFSVHIWKVCSRAFFQHTYLEHTTAVRKPSRGSYQSPLYTASQLANVINDFQADSPNTQQKVADVYEPPGVFQLHPGGVLGSLPADNLADVQREASVVYETPVIVHQDPIAALEEEDEGDNADDEESNRSDWSLGIKKQALIEHELIERQKVWVRLRHLQQYVVPDPDTSCPSIEIPKQGLKINGSGVQTPAREPRLVVGGLRRSARRLKQQPERFAESRYSIWHNEG